jgi:lipopolysaccharide/colanic/teichoic acid biosynthesis glycosyltransferase
VGFTAFKRGLDLLGGAAGLFASGPLLLGCAAWIKCVDGGPVLYRQWRVGRDGVLFRIYKLRTMRSNAERPGTARFASTRDPRVMPGCSWMRRSHVDELPQFWNILKGDMSLVGPRPERPEIYEELRVNLPRVERRLATKPGLTGLAQVRNGYTNDVAGARRKLAYDLRYLRRRTVLGELSLVLQTIPKVWDQAAL